MRRRRGRERVCVLHIETQTRGSESCVEAHQRRKKPDLLSPKINCRCQLTDSSSAANYRHSRKDLLSSEFASLHTLTHTHTHTHILTNTNIDLHWATVNILVVHTFTYISMHTCLTAPWSLLKSKCLKPKVKGFSSVLFPAELSKWMQTADNKDVN